jgi:hypothetical protein
MTDYKEYFIHEKCVALKGKPVDRTLFNNYDYACLLEFIDSNRLTESAGHIVKAYIELGSLYHA